MFAEARKAKMDLAALGAQLATRKAELEAQSERGWAHVPRNKALKKPCANDSASWGAH